mmetsp:Transcript_32898/g.52699  ORF Transcript_32898/g.52699 Transcript_32898/m.52699 type:complete len:99 (+) Transcript_32898:948-1244(+)
MDNSYRVFTEEVCVLCAVRGGLNVPHALRKARGRSGGGRVWHDGQGGGDESFDVVRGSSFRKFSPQGTCGAALTFMRGMFTQERRPPFWQRRPGRRRQ